MERKSLFQLSWPLFINMFLAIGISFVDSLMISQYSNDAAAAVSMANQILSVAYDVSALLSIGAAIYIAQMIGANRFDEAKKFASNSLVGGALFGLIITIILIACSPILLKLVNTPDEIRSDTMIYLAISAISLMANGLFIGGASVLRSFSKTKDILILGIFANVFYLLFSYALIFGEFGVPELGVKGSALATLLIRVLGSILLLIVIWKRLGITLRFSIKDMYHDSIKMIRVAYPSVGENMLYNIYQLVIVSLIGILGVSSILTRSYVLTVTAFVSLFTITLTQANDILVGYAKGNGETEKAYHRGIKTSILNAIICTSIAAIIAIFSHPLIGMFTEQKEIVRLTTIVLWINVFIQPAQAIQMVLFSSLKSVGETIKPALWNIGTTWLLAVPLAIVGIKIFHLGLPFIWSIFIVEEILKAIWMYRLWKKRSWIKNRLVEDTELRVIS
ncbi:MATE family efflux transporter [Peribacillus muralis]|uniref:MATE family efflux transporter n=1 Tax=Peribacillus muralis TaxID=264697 RepID=UPI0037FFE8CA